MLGKRDPQNTALRERVTWIVPDDPGIFAGAATVMLFRCRWYACIYLPAIFILMLVSFVLLESCDQSWVAVMFILTPGLATAPISFVRHAAKGQYRKVRHLLPMRAWLDSEGIGSKTGGKHVWSALRIVVETNKYFFIRLSEPERSLFVPKSSLVGKVDRVRDILKSHATFSLMV